MKEKAAKLELMKRASVGQVLFRCARLWNEEALRRVRELTGESDLRLSHTILFPHLSMEGTRLTTLAEKLEVSKQAVSTLVEELVDMGFLEKIQDPADGRARLLCVTEKGFLGMEQGLRVLLALQSELAERMGAEKMRHFQEILWDLEVALEQTIESH